VKKKAFIICVIIVSLFCTGMMASAAPYEVGQWDYGNAWGYLAIWNPETVVSSTTQSDYVLSGSAVPGSLVSVYRFDPYAGVYKMYWNGSQAIGSSGIFVQPVRLYEGNNEILIRCDAYGLTQHYRIGINLLVGPFWDNIQGQPLDVQQGLQGIFG